MTITKISQLKSEGPAFAKKKLANAKYAFTSWQAFKWWVQVEDTPLDEHGHKSKVTWSNEGNY